MISVI